MLKKLAYKSMGVLTTLVMALAVGTVSNLCFFFYNQPDVPKSLQSYEG